MSPIISYMPDYKDVIKFSEVLIKFKDKLMQLHYSFEFKYDDSNIRIFSRNDGFHVYFGAMPIPAMIIRINSDDITDDNCISNLEWISIGRMSNKIDDYELQGTQYLEEPDAFDFTMDLQYDKFYSECYKLHAAISRSQNISNIQIKIKHFFYYKINLMEVMKVMDKTPMFWKGVL